MALIYRIINKDIKYHKIIRCLSSLSLPKKRSTFSLFKAYDNSLIYEKNYTKKSGKSFLRRTIDIITGINKNITISILLRS